MEPDQIQFRYTANQGEIYHRCAIDWTSDVIVLGDAANAAYEWAITREGEVLQYSNDAYGSVAAALRDGLTAALA